MRCRLDLWKTTYGQYISCRDAYCEEGFKEIVVVSWVLVLRRIFYSPWLPAEIQPSPEFPPGEHIDSLWHKQRSTNFKSLKSSDMDQVWAILDEIPVMRTTRSEGFRIFMKTSVVCTFQPRLKSPDWDLCTCGIASLPPASSLLSRRNNLEKVPPSKYIH